MYRITYTQGNGYTCGCCRQEWTNTEDFATREEMMKWLTEYHAAYLCRGKVSVPMVLNVVSTLFWEDADDRSIIDIREIGDDIQGQFMPDDKDIDALIKEKLDQHNQELKKKEAENERKTLVQDKKEYERLKAKFVGG